MIEDLATSSGVRIRTTECSLCGKRYGEDYRQYSSHLAAEHTFEDLNITPSPTQASRRVVTDGGRPTLTFADDLIAPVIENAKTATVRLHGPNLEVRDHITAVDEDGTEFATLEIQAAARVNASRAHEVLEVFRADYPATSSMDVLAALRRHYDEPVVPSTPVDVYVFECVEDDGVPERSLRADGGGKGRLCKDGNERSPFERKVDSIATVLDDLAPMQVLKAIEQLADDPESLMETSDVVTTASNVATDEEIERTVGTDESASGPDDIDRVVVGIDEAERIADALEGLYHHTSENAYDITDEQAARDAMMLRDRGEIEPNPDLLGGDPDVQ